MRLICRNKGKLKLPAAVMSQPLLLRPKIAQPGWQSLEKAEQALAWESPPLSANFPCDASPTLLRLCPEPFMGGPPPLEPFMGSPSPLGKCQVLTAQLTGGKF